MALAASNLEISGSATGATSYATGSIAPTGNSLVILAVRNAMAAPTPNTPTATGGGMTTWTQIATLLDGAATRRMTFFRSLQASPGSGTITIDMAGQSQANCNWAIAQFSGVDIGGSNGANAVVQNASNTANATNTGITVTLSAFGNTNNMSYGYVVKNGSNDPAIGSGFTTLGTFNTVNRTNHEYKINDASVVWTWGSESNVSIAMAIEIKAFAAGGGNLSLLGVG